MRVSALRVGLARIVPGCPDVSDHSVPVPLYVDLLPVVLASVRVLRISIGSDLGDRVDDLRRHQRQAELSGVRFGEPETADGALKPILSNPVIFAVNLYETPLAEKIERNFREMLVPGGVRASLKKI